ncbi:DUF7537 family lipoprotein [Serinicoccus chungangensis]|uniref:DUF7537 family lipoprotein n=1 Tax=Serinicoccus chungangensis TaxID=767452 RepID=UPI00111930EC|nr:hypothetical protein [Serinicoccus chungangensis]
MSTTRMRLGAVVSAGILGLGLTGCGGGSEGDAASPTEAATQESTPDGEEESAEDTAAEDTAEESESDSGGEAAEGEEIPVEEFLAMLQEPGEETLSSYTLTMDMQADGQSIQADGAVDLSGDEAAMQMMMTMPEMGELEMITTDGQLYLAMPGVTPEGMYMQAGEDVLGQAAAMEDIDVSTQWEAWEEGAQQVLFLGDEDVDGTEMGHYQVTVDPQAIAEAGGEDAAAMTAAVGDEPVTYDVWLDDDNLMRQLSFELEGMTAEMMMDNWGEPQEIEAPPADQVMEMGDLGTTPGSDG